jgi:glutamate racemase
MARHPMRPPVRVALIDSGYGLLPTAGWLRHLRPDLGLDLYLDPEGMPWGSKSSAWIVERVLDTGRRAVARGADAIVVPCNTASVTAIVPLRAAVEPERPVVATVPAVKPAGATGRPFAIWATERTTGSDYQRDLVERFAAPGQADAVACPGLARAVEDADPDAVRGAVALAADRTPARCRSVVLGCTHYPLVVEEILAALPPGTGLHDSSRAVAGQTLRRLGLPEDPAAEPADVRVHLGGDEGPLPGTACRYPIGAALAAGGRVTRHDLPVTDESDQQTRPDTASHPDPPVAPPALRGV